VKEIIINSYVAVSVGNDDDAEDDNVDEIMIVIITSTIIWYIRLRWKR
jgi:hypothetical protein